MVQKIDRVLVEQQTPEGTGTLSNITPKVSRPKTQQFERVAKTTVSKNPEKKRRTVLSKKKPGSPVAAAKTTRDKKLSKFEQVYKDLSPQI